MSRDAAAPPLRAEQVTIPRGHPFTRLPWIGVGIGAVGLVVSLMTRGADPSQFAFSWLVAFLFFGFVFIVRRPELQLPARLLTIPHSPLLEGSRL
jgi:hypothetical protein